MQQPASVNEGGGGVKVGQVKWRGNKRQGLFPVSSGLRLVCMVTAHVMQRQHNEMKCDNQPANETHA